ncbi:MAG: DinB family protein [Bryobacteraceae bacterium]
MTPTDRFKIIAPPGYAPEVGRLVCAMERVRARTLEAVAGLTMAQLDHLHDATSNSIGALLTHMAAIETLHGIGSFEDRMPTQEEFGRWGAAFALGDAARATIKGKPLEHYLEILAGVRDNTKARLRDKPDAWLLEERGYVEGERANNWYIWFHVPEDETNHRGQINWLRKRLS